MELPRIVADEAHSEADCQEHAYAGCRHSEGVLQRLVEHVDALADRLGRPVIVGLGGPGGTGKSTLAKILCRSLLGSAMLPLDDYRKPRAERAASGHLGSHPEGNCLDLLRTHLACARAGKSFERPVFDPVAGFASDTEIIHAERILITEGEIAAHAHLTDAFDVRILVDAHWRTQLDTRLTRDIQARGYSLERAIEVFLQSNLRDYPKFADHVADFVLYRTRRGRLKLRSGPADVGGSSDITEPKEA